jgi:hypothetical protein
MALRCQQTPPTDYFTGKPEFPPTIGECSLLHTLASKFRDAEEVLYLHCFHRFAVDALPPHRGAFAG